MNKIILTGRATADAKVTVAQGENPLSIARFILAVDRMAAKSEQKADFPNCVAFGKKADFCEKYVTKGKKFNIVGRLQTGSYTNKEGTKVYTTDVVIEEIEFGESKGETEQPAPVDEGGFMAIPDGMEELPFA
ncbi:MAG: single-stranded DNA-binding protein [Bacteroidales bacterium]|nr:single-stranded DNA-binding protein [Candidatus Scybalousia scybalohippi]